MHEKSKDYFSREKMLLFRYNWLIFHGTGRWPSLICSTLLLVLLDGLASDFSYVIYISTKQIIQNCLSGMSRSFLPWESTQAFLALQKWHLVFNISSLYSNLSFPLSPEYIFKGVVCDQEPMGSWCDLFSRSGPHEVIKKTNLKTSV